MARAKLGAREGEGMLLRAVEAGKGSQSGIQSVAWQTGNQSAASRAGDGRSARISL